MSEKLLTMNGYGDALKPRMSKTSRVKRYDADTDGFIMTPDALDLDATKQETIYRLLYESLTYKLCEDEAIKIPDISKEWISKTINGKIPLNSEILKAAQKREATTIVAAYFNNNIIPNIPKHLLCEAVNSISSLVLGDYSISKEKRDSLKQAKEKKSEADYLADVWILAVCKCTEYQCRKPDKAAFSITDTATMVADNTPVYTDAKETIIADPVPSSDLIQQSDLFDTNQIVTKDNDTMPYVMENLSADVNAARSGRWRKTIAITVICVEALIIICLAAILYLKRDVVFPLVGSVIKESVEETDDIIPEEIEEEDKEPEKPLKDIPLFSRLYTEIGDSDCYYISGSFDNNQLYVYSTTETILEDGQSSYSNYVTYSLGGMATRFSAVLHPPKYPAYNFELVYQIFGDGELQFEALMDMNSSPVMVNIDVTGIDDLMIVVDFTGKMFSLNYELVFGCIENATVMTTDY